MRRKDESRDTRTYPRDRLWMKYIDQLLFPFSYRSLIKHARGEYHKYASEFVCFPAN